MHSTRKKLLVVDDEPDILEFLHIILEEEGYEVVTSTGRDYPEHLQSGGLPDLILLDIVLSGADGCEVVTSLKGRQETRRIPVIMFSARASAEHTARAAGADDFIDKPFTLEVLLAKVASYV
jgi:DNA-binding response OmpR family regulator